MNVTRYFRTFELADARLRVIVWRRTRGWLPFAVTNPHKDDGALAGFGPLWVEWWTE